jgi:membrane associated rhomboid family serine protease
MTAPSSEPTRPRAPLVVWALVAAIIGGYAAYVFAPAAAKESADLALALIPVRFHADSPLPFAHWYEAAGPIVGHAFLHAGWWHAGLNAFFFFLLARIPARRLGALRFLILFFVSAASGALAFLALNWNSEDFAVGASGAVCGVFSAYYMSLAPHWRQALAHPGIRKQFATIFFVNVVLMGVAAETGLFPIAWEAHLGGFIGGALAYIALAPRRAGGPWG